jgi:hypothetical protein
MGQKISNFIKSDYDISFELEKTVNKNMCPSCKELEFFERAAFESDCFYSKKDKHLT